VRKSSEPGRTEAEGTLATLAQVGKDRQADPDKWEALNITLRSLAFFLKERIF
jgi:hypothetical protein